MRKAQNLYVKTAITVNEVQERGPRREDKILLINRYKQWWTNEKPEGDHGSYDRCSNGGNGSQITRNREDVGLEDKIMSKQAERQQQSRYCTSMQSIY